MLIMGIFRFVVGYSRKRHIVKGRGVSARKTKEGKGEPPVKDVRPTSLPPNDTGDQTISNTDGFGKS